MKDINLLPENLKDNRPGSNVKLEELRDKIDPKMILLGIVIVLTLLVVFFLPVLYNSLLEQKLASIQKDIKSSDYDPVRQVRSAILEENSKIESKKNAITEIDNNNVSVNEIFSAINGILPIGCTVSTMTYDGKAIAISGTVAEDIQIGEIITRAKRLNFLVIDSNANISYDAKKNFNFTFNVAGKER